MARNPHRPAVAPLGSNLSMAELVDGFRRVCPIARAELVRRFECPLRRYAKRRLATLPMRPWRTVDDLMQDTWAELCRSLMMRPYVFTDEATFAAYLRRIVDGLVSHYRRASQTAKRGAHGEEALDARRHDHVGRELDPAIAAALANVHWF